MSNPPTPFESQSQPDDAANTPTPASQLTPEDAKTVIDAINDAERVEADCVNQNHVKQK